MIGSPGNPWLAKLKESEIHLALDDKALKLFERVSADPDEEVLATLACAHGMANRGFLVLTTHWLHWLQKFPKRHEFWSLDLALSLEGAMTSKILVLAGGPQFQPASVMSIGKLKEFYDYYGVLQRALTWESAQAGQSVLVPATIPAIPEQIAQLAALREQGHISSEEFESKKADLLSRM